MGTIYLIRNTVNDKCYIGQTIHDAVKGRINKHLNMKSGGSRLIRRAIRKYGRDVFTYEILHDGIIPEFLDTLEIEAIAKFNTVAPLGYNLTSGGQGGTPSEETRHKISEAHKTNPPNGMLGKKHSEETRHKMSQAGKTNPSNGMLGKKHTAETRRKMSESKKGKTLRPLSEETRHKISESNKGKTMSDEVREKISQANKGKSSPYKGIPRSLETRRKISEAKRGNKHSEEARRKMSEAKIRRSPYHEVAHQFFRSLPKTLSLPERRERLRERFPSVKRHTLNKWVRKWGSDGY